MCLFCPDDKANSYFTQTIEKHHIILRSQGGTDDDIIPLCTFHHRLYHDGKIDRTDLLKRANEYFTRIGSNRRYYLGHKKIKVEYV